MLRLLGWTFAGLLMLCLMVGCGGKGSPASLKGQVTYAKKPLDSGDIRLDPIGESKSQSAAAKVNAGQFEFPISAGLKAGKFKVSVYSFRAMGKKKDVETGKEVENSQQIIPEKYNRDSTLTAELKPGENTQDFNLE